MKTLKFKDGKEFKFRETSTLNTLVYDCTAFADLDAIKAEFEKADNFIGGVFDGEPIAETVYTGARVELSADGKIAAYFIARAYTADEIRDQRIADLEDTVADLMTTQE